MEYEWDEAKNQANIAKHGISFESMVDFQWDTAVIKSSDRSGETRWAAIGYIGSRLHHVVYTDRGGGRRIISLYKANPRDRRRYEQSHRDRS